jgi:hypothetical protein
MHCHLIAIGSGEGQNLLHLPFKSKFPSVWCFHQSLIIPSGWCFHQSVILQIVLAYGTERTPTIGNDIVWNLLRGSRLRGIR